MHDLVHDLARSVLVDEILEARKQGDTGENRFHMELLDDCTESLQAFTQYTTNIRGLCFLGSDKTVCHGGASSSSAKFKSVQVCGKIGIYDDDVFSSAKDLQVLDLSECSIRKLPNSIGNLKQLRYLNAPRVQHWVIPYHAMKLSKLTYLSLRGSSAILALPDSIAEMEGLMYLDLSGCSGINKLPLSFGKLTKLVHLDFSNCSQLTNVSESLKSLTNLEYLDLSYCENIGELSENLGRLLKLRNLNISGSSYVSSHHEFWPNAEVLVTLTKLECLNLSLAAIENLPEALNRFANLKYLHLGFLQRNHWLSRREGPISFENLKNLVYLDLTWSDAFHGVLETLGSLTKLQHLSLSGCSCFDDCTELHRSHMSEAITNLTELHYLDLSYCSGTRRHPKQAFFVFLECIGNLHNLEHLDLSNNRNLTSLPDSFCSLRKLHTLDLSRCTSLKDLPSFLNEMDRLKFLELTGCSSLGTLKQIQLNKSVAVLPRFVVQADCHNSGSNLFLINDVNPTDLMINRLENVKSVQEACSIKLAGKDRMKELELHWTKDAERFVEDMEVLQELVPPTSLQDLRIAGYNSVRFPEWFFGSIDFNLPNLVHISMSDLPKCNRLPPLGRLPNLERLKLEQMNGISEINWELCGSRQAFPRLRYFRLYEMDSLKVWYTTYSDDRDSVSEFMFPNLSELYIGNCPNLRLEPCPHRAYECMIGGRSDGIISSWGEGVSSPSCARITYLHVTECKLPVHQWRLLHHLPGLTNLTIHDCSDLSSSPEITQALSTVCVMHLKADLEELEVPNWLGQLASLEKLTLSCNEVKEPHDGFPRLTRLRSLHLERIRSIAKVQQWVGSLVSLQKLTIWSYDENLNDLAASFGRLTSLQKLQISASIKSLPESIRCLMSLKNLEITACESITSLPESIGCLTSLERLDISYCGGITSLPESIGCLTSLERLDISYCGRITSLPESIQQLTKLKWVKIHECGELEEWCKTEENKAKLAHLDVSFEAW